MIKEPCCYSESVECIYGCAIEHKEEGNTRIVSKNEKRKSSAKNKLFSTEMNIKLAYRALLMANDVLKCIHEKSNQNEHLSNRNNK